MLWFFSGGICALSADGDYESFSVLPALTYTTEWKELLVNGESGR